MSIRSKPHLTDVTIKKYSKKGNGIGYFERQDGEEWPVEVSFTMPGDKAEVMLLRKRSGVYKSVLLKMVESSPERREPKCKHFGVCGGCRWQHITPGGQLENKQQFIIKCFEELLNQDVELKDILPCNSEWHYRNKMEFSFSSDKAKIHYLGLIMDESSGKVFNLTECHLPSPWFAVCVDAARRWWKESHLEAYHGHKDTGSLRTLTLREGQRTGDRLINLTVSGNADYALKKQQIESFVAFMREVAEPDDPEQKLTIFLTIQQIKKGQPTQFFEMHLYGPDHIREILHIDSEAQEEPTSLEFHISSRAFFQPNTAQAEKLYSHALRLALIPKDGVVYDLYCGTGTLGICAAKRARQVVGIELSPESAHDARKNAQMNGFENVTILTGSVSDKLDEIRKEGLLPLPDLVMVDPPRAGLDVNALKHIIKLNAPKILYISCNPVTQAENVKELISAGYRVTVIQPVDQFPQTAHIENIVILSKEEV